MMYLKQTIRKLAELDTSGLPITSFYVDTDRRAHSLLQCVEVAHQLVRSTRSTLAASVISDEGRKSVERDLDEITRFLGVEPLDPLARGVAVFSCSARGFFETVRLATPVPNAAKVGPHPVIRPLVTLADEMAPYGIVLVDREKARFFAVGLGAMIELEPVVDDVPGRVRPASHYALSDNHIERHVDDHIHQHLKRVAEQIAVRFGEQDARRLVLGGTPDVVPALRSVLPSALAERVAGVMEGVMIITGRDEVLRRSIEVIADAERREETAITEQILESCSPGGVGVVGVEVTIQSVWRKAVQLLVIGSDLNAGAWRCVDCQRLYTAMGSCPECGGDAVWLDDVAEEAIRLAVCQDAEVEIVTDEACRRRIQGMAALLHYAAVRPSAAEALVGRGAER